MQKNSYEDTPKVSIVIPMYNCELYIERCIDSLLKQTYGNVEIIVVDDGSLDKGAKIVKDIQLKSEKIVYLYQDNSGPGMARNKAIEHATGKYVLFVDSDDYLGKNYIEDMVRCAEKNNSELVIAGYTLVYADKKKQVQILPKRYIKNVAEEWAYRISACCSRLYLKEFWSRHNLKFSQEKDARAEDVPISIYSNAMAKNISIVQNAEYYYYQHSESAMNNKKQKVIFEFPYLAFGNMYKRIKTLKIENGEDFFNFGILKFGAQFDLVIYRKATKEQKRKFENYFLELIGEEFCYVVESWKKIRLKIDLPIRHKVAIEIFLLKYRINR